MTSQTTDSYGEATFSSLKPGDYVLTELFPEDVNAAFIWACTSNVRSFTDNPFTPLTRFDADGNLGVSLRAGEELSWDIYNVPSRTDSGSGSSITITLLECPDNVASISQCPAGSSGVEFRLIPNGDSGQEATFTTDDDGIASGTADPGSYELEELGANWCFADSTAFDENGDFNVGTDAIEVVIYNCAA